MTDYNVDGRRVAKQKKLNATRRFIGNMMKDSLQNYPQASPYFEVEVDKLIALMDKLKEQNKNVSFTSLFVRIMADVLNNYPLLNSAVIGEELVTYASCNVGVGVGLEHGIFNVVIKEAQDKNIFEISDELKAKTNAIKENTLPLEDMKGSTFTISSIGSQGIKYSTVVMNPPESGMLAIGTTERRFVIQKDDTPVIRSITGLALTHNHTTIDGYHIGAIITLIKERLDNPEAYMGL